MSLSIGTSGISIHFVRFAHIFQILYRNLWNLSDSPSLIERKWTSKPNLQSRNEELIELMELEKTIVYFKGSLNKASAWLKLTSATSNINTLKTNCLKTPWLKLFSRIIEMADIYETSSFPWQTACSIISNNRTISWKPWGLMSLSVSVKPWFLAWIGFRQWDPPLNREPCLSGSCLYLYFASEHPALPHHQKWF